MTNLKMLKTKKGIWITALSLIIIATGSYFYYVKEDPSPYEFVVVTRGDIVQEVNLTGRVEPAESVDLSFDKSGRVVRVNKDIGNHVFAGEILISLYNVDLSAQLAEAKAKVEIEEAKLSELQRGSRPEEIKIQEGKVTSAKVALSESEKNLIDKINDSYTKSDDAIRNKIDQFFSNPRDNNPQIDFVVSDSQTERDVESGRVKVESVLISWNSELNNLALSSNLDVYLVSAKQNLAIIKSFLDGVALAINLLNPSANNPKATVDGWKSNVSTARANINTAIESLSAAEKGLSASRSTLSLEENELNLKRAGSSSEAIVAQEAQVNATRANVLNIEAQISKTILHSPISGIVARQKTKVGESVSANTIVVSVISLNRFEIEVDVPEADISKINIGDFADVTLEAYGEDSLFSAKIVAIDPAETIIEGVPTYKTTFQFTEEDERVRSGMTADLDIFTGRKENVITIPLRSIITKNGEKIVRILVDDPESRKRKIVREVKVKTGLRGSFGNIEIIEGVNEGDKVIVFLKEK